MHLHDESAEGLVALMKRLEEGGALLSAILERAGDDARSGSCRAGNALEGFYGEL